MKYHCFYNTYKVLFNPTREQTFQLANGCGHRPDGINQGAATQRQLHLPILYGKECSCSEQTASVVKPNELAD
jgi:hypothetical protein